MYHVCFPAFSCWKPPFFFIFVVLHSPGSSVNGNGYFFLFSFFWFPFQLICWRPPRDVDSYTIILTFIPPEENNQPQRAVCSTLSSIYGFTHLFLYAPNQPTPIAAKNKKKQRRKTKEPLEEQINFAREEKTQRITPTVMFDVRQPQHSIQHSTSKDV